jgi:hypothetical protein
MTKIINKKIKGANRHWKNFLDRNYLGSHNLEAGEEMLLTIEKFVGEEAVKTQDGDKIKTVLYFKEDVPKMIMNVTNGTMIASLYGSHPENWIGRQIQVYAASVKAFGKQQDALRIRDFVPKIEVDVPTFSVKLDEAKSLDDLKTIWTSFPVSAQKCKELIAKKDELKAKFV